MLTALIDRGAVTYLYIHQLVKVNSHSTLADLHIGKDFYKDIFVE